MLIGFAFIEVFLRFHKWMSLSLTLFIISMVLQIYVLFYGFWNKCWKTGFTSGLLINFDVII